MEYIQFCNKIKEVQKSKPLLFELGQDKIANDDLIRNIKKSKQIWLDIKDNINSQKKTEMQISETVLHFDFEKNIVKIKRLSDNPSIQYKSPYVEPTLEDFYVMFDFLL